MCASKSETQGQVPASLPGQSVPYSSMTMDEDNLDSELSSLFSTLTVAEREDSALILHSLQAEMHDMPRPMNGSESPNRRPHTILSARTPTNGQPRKFSTTKEKEIHQHQCRNPFSVRSEIRRATPSSPDLATKRSLLQPPVGEKPK
ncbi:hypothetical protein FB45DRAFT_1057951 [Roridomyces roridus]|uniref:Uncharacterized protein n=1 Tax=Roridomyces roridus TaxID=1738132 RepID=A0AAD7FMP0_9AGAR|nr:hypothetical protein FB45DRAFT_1057951 [Roridomyces roridus]